jgi:NAD+ synthase (glutamine-hydrolysing)
VRLLLTALRCEKGDLDGNGRRQLALLAAGREAGCDLVLLPEMSLTGYDPRAAVSLTHDLVAALVAATRDGPRLSFGLVEAATPEARDVRPTITQVLAGYGRVLAVHRKFALPPDEQPSFRAGPGFEPVCVGPATVVTAVCAEVGHHQPYGLAADIVLAPCAPGLYGPRRTSDQDWRRGFDWWRGSVLADADRLLRPGSVLAVSTQAGATADEDFPGWAALIGAGGTVHAELRDWGEGTLVVDTPTR